MPVSKASKPHFSSALLHPRYWLMWLALAGLALIAQLPFRWQMYLGCGLGRLLYRVAKRRRHIAETNIDLCFPELSIEARQQLVKQHFETNGITLFEVGIAWFMPYWRLKKRFRVKGEQHWQAIQQQGKGALVMAMHFNTLEITNVQINRMFNLYMSYRPHNNPVYDFVQSRGRQRHNAESQVVNRNDTRGMVRALKKGGWLWYAADQDYGSKVSEFIPFFGLPAATVSAAPRLAKVADVPTVAISYQRLPDYSGYEITFMPAFDGFPSTNAHADLVRLNQHFEQCIRANPAEYLWVHRRFKTRPKGAEDVYRRQSPR